MSTLTTHTSALMKVTTEKLWYHDALHRIIATPRLTQKVMRSFDHVLAAGTHGIHPTDLTALVEQAAKMLLPHCWFAADQVPQTDWMKLHPNRNPYPGEKVEVVETINVLNSLVGRADLTREHSLILWTAYTNLMLDWQKEERKPSGHLYPRLHTTVRETMASLLFTAGLSTASDAGSFWRLMMWAGLRNTLAATVQSPVSWTASVLVMCPASPGEVAARVLDDTSYSDKFIATVLRPRMETTYPELAGLPWGMLKDVVRSQPIPDEWFTDTFPMPASKRLPMLAPGIPNPEADL